jgi:transposase
MAQAPMSIRLRESDRKALEKQRYQRKNNLWERAQYVLRLSKGDSIGEISLLFGRHAHTIRAWIKRYQQQGLSGLTSVTPPGRPSLKQAKVEYQLETVLSAAPPDYGYIQEGWSMGILLDHFAKEHKLKLSVSTLSRALKKKGYVYKRLSKTMPIKAPCAADKKEIMQTLVAALKKETNNPDVELFFEDESHFSNEPYVSRGWFKRGEKKRLPRQARGKK